MKKLDKCGHGLIYDSVACKCVEEGIKNLEVWLSRKFNTNTIHNIRIINGPAIDGGRIYFIQYWFKIKLLQEDIKDLNELTKDLDITRSGRILLPRDTTKF